MEYIRHLIKTKGISGMCSRSKHIAKRFGLTCKKIEDCLDTFINITEEFNCTPTLCITATLLDNYPKLIKKFNQRKMETAIHGYVHIDYTALSQEETINHIIKAKEKLKSTELLFLDSDFLI